ncbi:DNA/RNA polymerases superfamily protein [Gossypium australe]|uniref:DNA/RNA polymerases superfamily protein n=1 Tax=Gossypium australe TaxID=47621 RepID=A0A5B6VNG8_9ROSI|nr:DNA/RNA polymerases superfamily protein [Gossypium australe]
MITVFSDMVENFLEVFMDDLSVFGMDKEKIEVIKKLPPPTTVKGIRSFLGHTRFYKRFNKDLLKISKTLCALLEHNRPLNFDEPFLRAFEELRKQLVTAPIVIPPQWTLPFDLMCHANDFAVGVVLRKRKNKVFHAINYSSRTLIDAQLNYTITKNELLAVVFAFDKFKSYLVRTKVTVYTNHSAIKYFVTKKDSNPRLIM